ncbi:MAG: family 2 encapsulin nanocompartment cargo protein terpene cyclase, partial [Stackebrandtia sp.]
MSVLSRVFAPAAVGEVAAAVVDLLSDANRVDPKALFARVDSAEAEPSAPRQVTPGLTGVGVSAARLPSPVAAAAA